LFCFQKPKQIVIGKMIFLVNLLLIMWSFYEQALFGQLHAYNPRRITLHLSVHHFLWRRKYSDGNRISCWFV